MIAISTLLFAASAAVTIVWGLSMSSMAGMPMAGGWTMSMTWMRMPGQTWPAAAASFLGMWIAMMMAMMLPSLIPMLRGYRGAVRVSGDARPGLGRGWLTAVVGTGYFFVWTLVGVIVYPLGIALAEIEMRHPAVSRAVPFAAGVIILIAGGIQFTAWKARQLACCDGDCGDEAAAHYRRRTLAADVDTAWRYGLRLGRDCGRACANLMLILLVAGVMDLRAMAIVTAAISAERLAPAGTRVARATGVVIVAAGSLLIARAAWIA